ncbi:hypothetical protein MTR67_052648 [Solanum verrucosum]|uniref:Uncharacterized protein n=1 Tax=Solanum verrucosum TaxID=315347 RepID=A0AAF0V9I8_SOLVR|nr:hypothetical protein MTR67_052648 [Solanum verrucosum]
MSEAGGEPRTTSTGRGLTYGPWMVTVSCTWIQFLRPGAEVKFSLVEMAGLMVEKPEVETSDDVITAVGESFVVDRAYRSCLVSLVGSDTCVDLIILGMVYFAIILGNVVSKEGIWIDPAKIEVVKECLDFTVYCDASGDGIGGVLMQKGKANVVVDALSRKTYSIGSLVVISVDERPLARYV